MSRRRLVAFTALALLPAALGPAARAEWRFLPEAARLVPLEATASRDAAVLAYAFGPSGQISLGHALTIASHRCVAGPDLHLGLTGLVALEDASHGTVLPDELMRVVATTEVAWTFGEGPGPRWELGLRIGVERARELVAAPSERVELQFGPRDIPFGAGGVFFGIDLALSTDLGARWGLDARVADRMFINAFPRALGFDAEAIEVASWLDEGLAHAPSLSIDLRWRASDAVQPVARGHVELLVPADDHADAAVRFRLLAGVALPGRLGELLPFVALDIGAGDGMLVNRHELRLSIGVRHALP